MVCRIEMRMDLQIAGDLAAQRASWISSNYAPSNPGHEDAHDLMHEDVHGRKPELNHNPKIGETSDLALTLVGESNHTHEEEAVYENRRETMADQKWTVPNFPKNPTKEQVDRAIEECRKKDPKDELDRFLTSQSSNGFRLLLIRAREGVKAPDGTFVTTKNAKGETVKKYVTTTSCIWIPGFVDGTMEQFVAWFAHRYFGEVSEATMQAAFTKFKKKAIDAELVTIRSKMKSKTVGGRSSDIAF